MATHRFLVIIYNAVGCFLGGYGCAYFFCAQPVQHVIVDTVFHFVQLPIDVLGDSAAFAQGKGGAVLPAHFSLGSGVVVYA